jgi:ABC-type sugar transport system substrate-binding protein
MGKKVVISLLERGQEYQQFLADDGRRAAQEAGFEPEVIFADGNAILQIRQLYAYVHAPQAERPAAILILSVAGHGGDRLAQAAVKAGIAWIAINRDIENLDQLRREAKDVPVFAVNVDHVEIGRLQGRLLAELFPYGGSVLYVHGPPMTASATARYVGIQETRSASNAELRVVFADWTAAGAERAVASWLQLKPDQIGAVVAQNDAMAKGARAALVSGQFRAAKLPIIGCDGLPHAGQKFVKEGWLTATVVVPPPTTPAIKLLRQALRDKVMPPPVTRLPLSCYPPSLDVSGTDVNDAEG